MAYPIHGKVCRIEKNSTNAAYSQGWTINTGLDLDDISAQGDSWKSAVAGLAEWDGDMSFHFDPSDASQLAILQALVTATPGTKLTDVEFTLEDSGDYFSGDLFVTGVSVKTAVSGKVPMEVKFKGDGALSLTIA